MSPIILRCPQHYRIVSPHVADPDEWPAWVRDTVAAIVIDGYADDGTSWGRVITKHGSELTVHEFGIDMLVLIGSEIVVMDRFKMGNVGIVLKP